MTTQISLAHVGYGILYYILDTKKELVHVLDGGLEKWKNEKLPLTDKINFFNKI